MLDKEKSGLIVRYKYPPDTPTISLLMECEINGPAAHIISLA